MWTLIPAYLYLSVNKLILKHITMVPSCIQNHPVRFALAFVFVFDLFFVIFTILGLVWKLATAGLRWSTSSALLCSAFVLVFILVVFVFAFVFFLVFVIALS